MAAYRTASRLFPGSHVPWLGIGIEYSLEPVDTAAALGSGSAPLPSLPPPRARAPPLTLGCGPSPFVEVTS